MSENMRKIDPMLTKLPKRQEPKKQPTFSDLVGKTLTSIEKTGPEDGDDEMVFKTTEGKTYKLYHDQSCCERVTIDDICGDLSDLIGTPILQAEENSSNENPPGVCKEHHDSFTWTFYRIATIKGQVVIRWYGVSNGYYSERVDFEEIK